MATLNRSRIIAWVVVLVGSAAAGISAQAEFWSGFYRPSAAAKEPTITAMAPETACLSAIVDAQTRYGIPGNLLLAIGVQEAGRRRNGNLTVWPWAANADGKGVFFHGQPEAVSWVRAQQAAGTRSIDVGCMQVNLKWHGDGFDSLESAFDPVTNVDYAARFLLSLYRRKGDWWQAAGAYHSSTKALQDKYLASLKRNQNVVNAGIDQILAHARLAVRFPARATPEMQRQPRPPVLWSSALGNAPGSDPSQRFSIYSRRSLTPVLPGFKDMF